jgi:multiple sugar transport system ATP-binding protein
VTHDQIEAMTMGSRIAILHKGILQQVGSPLEVYERPQNLFVANFIGTPPMNFVNATVGEGGASLKAKAFELPVPGDARESLASRVGKTIVVGIRPEHVIEASRTTRGATAPLEVLADLVETLGDEVIVHGHVGDDAISLKMDPHKPPEIGDKVPVLVEIDKLHLFDAETEKRI